MPLSNRLTNDPVDNDHPSNIWISAALKPPKNKMGLNYKPLYEGDEVPKKHWFVCEKFWFANDIDNEEKIDYTICSSLKETCFNLVYGYY